MPRGRDLAWYRRAWIVALVLTASTAVWIHLGIGGAFATTAFTDITVTLGALAAAAALAVAWHRTAEGTRRGWGLLAIGAGLEALGEISWTVYELGLGEVPYPGLADVFYLGGYPFLAVGFIALAWHRESTVPGVQHTLDGLLVGVALLTISWPLVLEPLAGLSEVSRFELGVSMAYPMLDIVVGATALVVALHARGPRRVPMALVAGGIFVWAFGDSTFAYLAVTDGYTAGVLDTAWILGDVLIAMGALHPGATATPSPAEERRRYRFRETIFPYAPFLLAMGVLFYLGFTGRLYRTEIVLGLTLIGLLVTRQGLVLWHASSISRDLAVSEQRFQELAGNVEEALWVLGPDVRTFEYASPNARRLYGIAEDGPMETLDQLLVHVHPEDLEEMQGRLGEVAALLQASPVDPDALAEAIEAPVVHRIEDGERYRWLETKGQALLDPQGRLRKIVGVTRDITDRVDAQRLREQAIERETELDKMREMEAFKDQFLNMAAHELATPLTPLKFQIDALQEGLVGDPSAEQLDALEVADRAVVRLEHLVGHLIDATNLQANELEIDPAPADLVEILEAGLATARTLGTGECNVTTHLPEAPHAIVGDADRLERALASLLLQACEEADGSHVEVHLEDTAEGSRITVHVPAVEPGRVDVDALFEPFEGLEGHRQGEDEGSGLGLFVARGVLSAHGGHLGASLTEDGLRFQLEIPAADQDATTTSTPQGSPEESRSSTS